MEEIAADNIFLFECVLDSVNLKPEVEADVNCSIGIIFASFQFLGYDPLIVSEEGVPSGGKNYQISSNTKNGKSALISLSHDQAKGATEEFEIKVQVYKKLCPGKIPEKVQIGEAFINILEVFNEMLVECIGARGEKLVSTDLEEKIKIFDTKDEEVGTIGVFIRITCFGKILTSPFQIDLDKRGGEITSTCYCKFVEGLSYVSSPFCGSCICSCSSQFGPNLVPCGSPPVCTCSDYEETKPASICWSTSSCKQTTPEQFPSPLSNFGPRMMFSLSNASCNLGSRQNLNCIPTFNCKSRCFQQICGSSGCCMSQSRYCTPSFFFPPRC